MTTAAKTSLRKLENFSLGKWISGEGDGQILYNAINGEEIATASSKGLDFAKMCDYARTVGGPKLRKMTFYERGRMLKELAIHLQSKKDIFYKISWATGATKADSWVDIEGGIGNLFSYASLRRQFPNESFCLEGDVAKLSKQNTFIGHHICVPKEGVAIHINAFNFPVWGMLEKVAVNWFAGVPAIVKPATITSFLTEAVVREIIASGILPEGALQLICGSANGILAHVINQDIITFTGSASTGKMLKAHPRLLEEAVPFNMEADSLNCCVLGSDVTPDKPEFDIFIKEVVREITTKAGQKCTAVRRIIVPENRIEEVRTALGKRLASNIIGDPNVEGVRMGSLAGQSQLKEVKEKVEQLSKSQKIIIGDFEKFEVKGADKNKGAFMPPIIFLNENPFKNTDCHNIEAFGPVSTIMPYKNMEDAIQLAKMGKGSLVSSIITADDKIAKQYVLGAASMHGRILILNSDCAKESTGHGSPMPMLVHGGPGRAGGGEEMGGKRGVFHYLQRTAIQGSPTTITNITNQYQMGAKYRLPLPPSFRGGTKPKLFMADPILYGKLKEFANHNRNNPTEAEEIVWTQLRTKQLENYKFRRQHIIGKYIADFYCYSHSLVIEIDGLVHSLPEIKENDEIRTQWLTEQGYNIMRLTNNEVIGNMDGALKKIIEKIKEIEREQKVSPEGGDLEGATHPFKHYFEELQVGETLITKTHTVSEDDIINFAELSGDKFYAHLQPDSLEGTIFKRTVAHGYFVLSRAAGLFVDPPKGPVLLNYGLDECRFTKPIYPGMTIGVRFTCKEKIENDKPLIASPKPPPSEGALKKVSPEGGDLEGAVEVKVGIVKWVVDIYDASSEEIRKKYDVDVSLGDTVGIATILTMVKKKRQS